MTPRVLLCATTTGYQIRMFDEAAARLGVELRLASDRCGVLDDPWRDHAIPVRYHDLETSLAAIRENIGRHAIDGVLAVGDRRGHRHAARSELTCRDGRAAAYLGHPSNARFPQRCGELSQHKGIY
jgi:hypothetical protein